MPDLIDEVERFAAILSEVVNGTVASDVSFVVTPLEDPPRLAWIYPEKSTPARVQLVPVTSTLEAGDERIRASYQVRLDDSGEHLAVQRSVYGLVIDESTGRPAIRMEYDRDEGSEPDDGNPGRHRRSAAHVQIHGSSEELAFVQGLNGERPLRGLEKFHVPVGGRRFRPSLEDFIEFLWAERLIPRLHEGWRDVVGQHRADWLSLQLRSAVRNDPEAAAAQLRSMGYEVAPPATR